VVPLGSNASTVRVTLPPPGGDQPSTSAILPALLLLSKFVNVSRFSVHEAALRWRAHEFVEYLAWHVVVDVGRASHVADM